MITSTIKFSQTKTQQPNPQIFTIWSDEIEGRIDPYFYILKELASYLQNGKKSAPFRGILPLER